MRFLMVLLYLLPSCALAQELSVEDRACITAAAGKLPTIAALEIKGSRAPARPVQGWRNQKLHNAIVEIDVSVAVHSSTYIFNCIVDTGKQRIPKLHPRLQAVVATATNCGRMRA
jgi:hypothetical protein